MALSTSCPLPSLSPKTSLGKRRGGRESSDGSPARQLVSSRPFPALLALQTAIPTHQGCPAPQSGGWQPATLTPDFTWFPPSRAQGSRLLSPEPGQGPLPWATFFPSPDPAQKVSPYQHSLCAHPHPPTSPKTQHEHPCTLIPGRGWPLEGGPLDRSAPQGARAQVPGPALVPAPVSSFPRRCFSPSPLHLSLRGSCTIPWELHMWPSITHSALPEGLSHPQVYPTHRDSQLQSHPPGSPGMGSAPAPPSLSL